MAAVTLQILIDGTEIRDITQSSHAVVGSVEVFAELNHHSRCTVELRQTPDLRPPIESWIGKTLEIFSTAQDPLGRQIFCGFVLDVQLEYEISGSFKAVLQGVSLSYKLDLATRVFYYGQASISDVASKIKGRAGVQADVRSGGDIQPPMDLVQWAETDWHFLWRLCDDFGLYVMPTKDGIRIDRGFPDSGPTLTWRTNEDTSLISFTIRGALAPPKVDGCHYDFTQSSSQSFQGETRDPSVTDAIDALVSAVKREAAANLGAAYKHWRNRAFSVSDYQNSLQSEAEWSIGSQFVCEGVTRSEGLAPGLKIQVDGVIDGQGTYNIFRVLHHWDQAGYTNHFSCTPWTNYRSFPHPKRPKLSGIHPARVTGIDDPDRMGRVKVQFFWQEEGDSTWIRHLSPYAGEDRGIFFRPEIGDEVMVAFEAGDPERPVIVGSAWNKSDGTPNEDFWADETHNNDVKRIVTKSGHRFSMVDKEGKEAIGIATPVHTKIVLHEKTDETGRPAIMICVEDGDIMLSAPNGRIHFHAKYWSREVG